MRCSIDAETLLRLLLSDSGIRYQSQLFISTLERTLTLHPQVKVSLIWIPGHVGIAGNELADRMAVAGSTTTFLARRARAKKGEAKEGEKVREDEEGDMPVILARRVPKSLKEGEREGAGAVETGPTDDTLIAGKGSLFVARLAIIEVSPCRKMATDD